MRILNKVDMIEECGFWISLLSNFYFELLCKFTVANRFIYLIFRREHEYNSQNESLQNEYKPSYTKQSNDEFINDATWRKIQEEQAKIDEDHKQTNLEVDHKHSEYENFRIQAKQENEDQSEC